MNKVILAGRLVRDPKLRYTQTGKTVASFTLAVNRRFSHNNEQQTADFIPIIVWDKLAEVCSKHLFKGSQVLIEGRMQVRNYEAQDGRMLMFFVKQHKISLHEEKMFVILIFTNVVKYKSCPNRTTKSEVFL